MVDQEKMSLWLSHFRWNISIHHLIIFPVLWPDLSYLRRRGDCYAGEIWKARFHCENERIKWFSSTRRQSGQRDDHRPFWICVLWRHRRPHKNAKAGVFKLLFFEERFRKASRDGLLWTVGLTVVHKAAILKFPSVTWSRPRFVILYQVNWLHNWTFGPVTKLSYQTTQYDSCTCNILKNKSQPFEIKHFLRVCPVKSTWFFLTKQRPPLRNGVTVI